MRTGVPAPGKAASESLRQGADGGVERAVVQGVLDAPLDAIADLPGLLQHFCPHIDDRLGRRTGRVGVNRVGLFRLHTHRTGPAKAKKLPFLMQGSCRYLKATLARCLLADR